MEKWDKCSCGCNHWHVLAKVVLIVLVIYLAAGWLKPAEASTIDTSGSAEASVMPDKAYIFLGAETQSDTAADSQSENAGIIDAIKASLSEMNVKIETSSYYVTAVYSYKEDTPKVIGYSTTHILKITTTDVETAGKVIDAASKGGANAVSNIQFDLSDEKEKAARQNLLSNAVDDARQKADIIAKAAGVSIKKPMHISESWNMPYPLYEKAMAAGAETSISPQELQLSVSISVSWKI